MVHVSTLSTFHVTDVYIKLFLINSFIFSYFLLPHETERTF